MKDLKLDADGDLLIDQYSLKLVDNIDQIIQNISIRLRFFLNEWFLDINAGLPWLEDILIKAPNQIRVESLIKDEILTTPGVDEITFFESNFDASLRKFFVNFSATADQTEFDMEVDLIV